MNSAYAKKIIQNIISGVISHKPKDNLTAIRNILCASFATNTKITKDFEHQQIIKEEQRLILSKFLNDNGALFNSNLDFSLYLTKGGEAKVYYSANDDFVLKINDGCYYNNWLDFFNSIAIHNILFPETAYDVVGFEEVDLNLNIVLKQKFIVSNEPVNLEEVSELLLYNGFEKMRLLDYYNEEMGIWLEDIHDENVIKQNGSYFFIDTVFYIDVKDK
jgi:Serine/Threonine/Tyrosine Kinase found in polyvalent proteins